MFIRSILVCRLFPIALSVSMTFLGIDALARSADSGSIRVEILCLEPGTVKPMEDVRVTLHRGHGPAIREAQTGADGLVIFEDLEPASDYLVRAEKTSYVSMVFPDVAVRAGRRTSIKAHLPRRDQL